VKAALLTVLMSLSAAPALAQTRGTGLGLAAGTGVELGGGSGEAVILRSPFFLDLAARTWTDEQPDMMWGGSLRAEIEGRTSVAIVPRAELSRRVGPIAVRPSVGVPFFFAPFTMLGLEAGLTAVLDLGHGLGALATFTAAAFFLGSDVPEGSAVLMFNGVLGAELTI
jgi:hypothetical protein